MSTVTLSVSPEIKTLLESDAVARKRLEDLAAALFAKGGAYHPLRNEPPLTPDLIESLSRSFAQSDAGEVVDGDIVFAELYESVGLTNPPVFNRNNPRRGFAGVE